MIAQNELNNEKTIKRGDIYHINSGKTTTTGYEMWPERPAIIVSNNVACEKAGFVNVVYLTTQRKNKKPLPTHICVISGDKEAIALCEQIYAVDKSRIGFKIGEVTETEMKNIEKAIMFSLGISNTVKPSTIFKKWANAVERYDIDPKQYMEYYNEKTNTPAETDAANNIPSDNKICEMYKTLYQHEKQMRQELDEMLLSMQTKEKLCENA